MSQWDKLVAGILKQNPNQRFEDLYKALTKTGYTAEQPRGGSSHYTFRKDGAMPITLPMHVPMKKAYINLVADAVRAYLQEVRDE